MKTIKDGFLCLHDIISDQLSEFTNDIALLTKEYIIFQEGDKPTEIHMNQSSFSLLLKSITIKNPQVIFLTSVINVFQNLTTSTGKCTVEYRTTTHSLTIHLMRILERLGIIQIAGYHKCKKKIDFNDYYKIIGNDKKRTRPTSMYDVKFIKLRNLTEDDLEAIKVIARALKIEENQIDYKIENGTLKASIGPKLILDGITSRQFIKRLKTRFTPKYDSSNKAKRFLYKRMVAKQEREEQKNNS